MEREDVKKDCQVAKECITSLGQEVQNLCVSGSLHLSSPLSSISMTRWSWKHCWSGTLWGQHGRKGVVYTGTHVHISLKQFTPRACIVQYSTTGQLRSLETKKQRFVSYKVKSTRCVGRKLWVPSRWIWSSLPMLFINAFHQDLIRKEEQTRQALNVAQEEGQKLVKQVQVCLSQVCESHGTHLTTIRRQKLSWVAFRLPMSKKGVTSQTSFGYVLWSRAPNVSCWSKLLLVSQSSIGYQHAGPEQYSRRNSACPTGGWGVSYTVTWSHLFVW